MGSKKREDLRSNNIGKTPRNSKGNGELGYCKKGKRVIVNEPATPTSRLRGKTDNSKTMD